MTLYKKLTHPKFLDPLHASRQYVPRDIVDKAMTKDNIEAQLGKKGRTCMKFRSSPAEKIVTRNAKNLLAVLVFCKKAGDVEDLLEHGFTDEDLPLISTKDDLPLPSTKDSFKSTDEASETMEHDFELRSAGDPKKKWRPPEEWDEQDVDCFLQMQWMFLAPVFDVSGTHRQILRDCPLPFSDFTEIMSHNTVVVYKAKVNSSHQQGFEKEAPNLHIALKEFKISKEFKKEQDNMEKIRGLQRYKHITQSLATFEQGDPKRYYIILPFAEGGDLTDFWRTKDIKSRTPALTLWSLKQMLGLADALQGLHKHIDIGANCRHGDLKPGNILHFITDGQPEGILKISDFGISRIHINETFQREGKPTTTRATTPSYEAPEASPILNLKQERSRRYDLWSMGCIYLEFVIWLVEDWEAVQSFTKARESDGNREMLFYQIDGTTAKVHQQVLDKMSCLRKHPQCSPGTALGELLDMIERSLLVVDVECRVDSTYLYNRLTKVVRQAEALPRYLVGEGQSMG
ncbi:Protein kinase-like (PK-like) [Glarea lozoyensis ATCC 20868]|uniref:Protein kinase-like (PK-like) n=1 Tax=Glarea lozoyensis (strain ATCC 20868 / MF5171) TaxID=1116229 RepID=S3D668_GLAL2|nr:Protein kinase-like (PK-like) [Glarea lozoyensis ATCC 20868]EPE27561.1 Protein kinase-like (PK-like) [Glarea lozoyensis ATCC 20868]